MRVNLKELCNLTGYGHRRIKKRLEGVSPLESLDRRSIYYESQIALPAIYQTAELVEIDLTTERALLAKEQRIAQELKNAEKIKELLPAAKVKEVWARIVLAVRTQLLTLPDRLAQVLETAETVEDRRAIIDKEIRDILDTLSQGGK